MQVFLDSDSTVSVELEAGKLCVNLADQRQVVLLENTQHFSVTKASDRIHIAALDDGGEMWHFWGRESFTADKLSDGAGRVQGVLLASDGRGNIHLVYLTEPIRGQGASLRHRIFTGQWSNPMLVTTHVLPDKWGFAASWDLKGFLHLAYLSYGDSHLMYRVFDPDKNHWSGAVPLVAKPCSRPQFFPSRSLTLAWIIEEGTGHLQLMQKGEHWSRIRTITPGQGHCSGLGFSRIDSDEYLVWRQGEKLWRLPLGVDEAQPEEAHMIDYSFVLNVIEGENGAIMVPLYTWRLEERETFGQLDESPLEKQPAEELRKMEPSLEDQQREAERQLQSAFIEQAFRLQMEWENLRQEYGNVQIEISNLREKVEEQRRELIDRIGSIPKPKLEPLTSRLERLEIRMTKLERELQSWQSSLESRLTRLEQASLALNRRVGALENPEPEEPRSLWKRLWWR